MRTTAQGQSQQQTAAEIDPAQLQHVTERLRTHGALGREQTVADREEVDRASHSEIMQQVRPVVPGQEIEVCIQKSRLSAKN